MTKAAINCHHCYYCQVALPSAPAIRVSIEITSCKPLHWLKSSLHLWRVNSVYGRLNRILQLYLHSVRSLIRVAPHECGQTIINFRCFNGVFEFDCSAKSTSTVCVRLLHFPATNQNKLSRWHLRNVKCKTDSVQRSLLSALFSSFGFIVSVNQFDQSTALQLKYTA